MEAQEQELIIYTYLPKSSNSLLIRFKDMVVGLLFYGLFLEKKQVEADRQARVGEKKSLANGPVMYCR